MMRSAMLTIILLFATTLLGQIELAEEVTEPPIPGVDVGQLFTIQELRDITGYELEEKWDYLPNAPGYIHEGVFHIVYNPDFGVAPEGLEGFADIPYNGRRCYYRTSASSGGEQVLIDFRAYESLQEVLDISSDDYEYIREDVVRFVSKCVVNPSIMDVWIVINVVSFDLSLEKKVDLSCRIATEGNVNLRAMAVRENLRSR